MPPRRLYLVLFLVLPLVTVGLGERLFEYVSQRYGATAAERVADWLALIETYKGHPEEEKLRAVNRFFNALEFVSDDKHWGKRDYWATPVEFLGTAGGDCEDFSIAKYFTLRELGVAVDKLRITYVRALELRQAHMILAYYPGVNDEPLILDNLIDDIRPGGQRPDLVPVYSFNGDGLWMAVERGKGRRVGGPAGISLWRDLMSRMNSEAEG